MSVAGGGKNKNKRKINHFYYYFFYFVLLKVRVGSPVKNSIKNKRPNDANAAKSRPLNNNTERHTENEMTKSFF